MNYLVIANPIPKINAFQLLYREIKLPAPTNGYKTSGIKTF
jgi:hypothetical protein